MAKTNKVATFSSKDQIEEKIDLYVQGLADGLSKKAAYEAAGYAVEASSSNACKFHKRYNKEIHNALRYKIGDAAPLALNALIRIMTTGQSETARVKAALEILDRSGHDKTTRIQVQEEAPKSRQDLEAQLKTLLKNEPNVTLLDS